MSTATAAIVVLALLVISATLWIAFSYRRDLAASRARVRRGSRVLKTRCGQIEIGETGVGTPLILVHGAGGGFDQGLSLGRQLAARGFRVVAPSRFGYLRTPLPPIASPAAQADAHGCLLDSLGIAQAAIIGVSAGAPSALQFAIRHPERCTGLVLVVPLAYKPPSQPSAASRPSRWRDRLLNIIVGADFPFWLVSRFARDTAIRMVLATPPQLVRAASPIEQGRVASLLTNILLLSARPKSGVFRISNRA